MNIEPSITATASQRGLTQDYTESRGAMVTLTILFFMWGFITSLNDILIPHLKAVFDLNFTQAMLVQFCFFGAYFLVSIPAGRIVSKLGFQKGIALGLIIAAVGCLLFIPAASVKIYLVFLSALFVLAAGITLLQVAANPLVTLLGNPATASSRLTLTQAFNSLGTTVAPILGGMWLFSDSQAETSVEAVNLPYAMIALTLVAIAIFFGWYKLPKPEAVNESGEATAQQSVFSYPRLLLGVGAIFLYVGAEVSIGSFLVNFFGLAHIANMGEHQASAYIAYYWGGAMVGRFIGAALMQKLPAGKLLLACCSGSIALIAIAMFGSGQLAMWSILAVGLCNSIMFPTIFSLALKDLGPMTSKGSGLLCLAIVGGAIVPVLQGVFADNLSLQLSFVLPMLCYVYIAYFGFYNRKI